jgi:hypothetical protein
MNYKGPCEDGSIHPYAKIQAFKPLTSNFLQDYDIAIIPPFQTCGHGYYVGLNYRNRAEQLVIHFIFKATGNL